MKKIMIAAALILVLASATSCRRGGNVDKGHDGMIGNHGGSTVTESSVMDDIDGVIDDIGNGSRRGNVNGSQNTSPDSSIQRMPSRIGNGSNPLGMDDIVPDKAGINS